jgi:hypothetical protein
MIADYIDVMFSCYTSSVPTPYASVEEILMEIKDKLLFKTPTSKR